MTNQELIRLFVRELKIFPHLDKLGLFNFLEGATYPNGEFIQARFTYFVGLGNIFIARKEFAASIVSGLEEPVFTLARLLENDNPKISRAKVDGHMEWFLDSNKLDFSVLNHQELAFLEVFLKRRRARKLEEEKRKESEQREYRRATLMRELSKVGTV